jgi:uncharacterized membrane protein YqjE
MFGLDFYQVLSLFCSICRVIWLILTIVFWIGTCATRFNLEILWLTTLGCFLDALVASFTSYVLTTPFAPSDSIVIYNFLLLLVLGYSLDRLYYLSECQDLVEKKHPTLKIIFMLIFFSFSFTFALIVMGKMVLVLLIFFWDVFKWSVENIIDHIRQLVLRTSHKINVKTTIKTATQNITRFNTTSVSL